MPHKAILVLCLLVIPLATQAASKLELDTRSEATLNDLFEKEPAAKELANKATGLLIFPRIIKAGVGVGGELGEGVLRIGEGNAGYYRLTSVSVGFQFGGQAKSEVVMFMTADALRQFQESDGWEAGVDGSIALIEFGVGKEIDTHSIQDPIIGFVFSNKGLMYNLSLEGSKFWQIKK
tara:strand:+ start:229 stop:762 length:534 start_codon:yes stop_codon:yes gene_type:complete